MIKNVSSCRLANIFLYKFLDIEYCVQARSLVTDMFIARDFGTLIWDYRHELVAGKLHSKYVLEAERPCVGDAFICKAKPRECYQRWSSDYRVG